MEVLQNLTNARETSIELLQAHRLSPQRELVGNAPNIRAEDDQLNDSVLQLDTDSVSPRRELVGSASNITAEVEKLNDSVLQLRIDSVSPRRELVGSVSEITAEAEQLNDSVLQLDIDPVSPRRELVGSASNITAEVEKLNDSVLQLRINSVSPRRELVGNVSEITAEAEQLNDSVLQLDIDSVSPRRELVGSASNITAKVEKLNDSVYELYRPPEGEVPSMEVVFFHGFQHANYEEAHLFTWLSEDKSCIWPQSWLKEKFPDARILTVSYNGGLHTTNSHQSGNIDMFSLVEILQSDLLSAEIGQQPRCPVVLVGHSFGGLVIKKLCVRAFHPATKSTRKLEYFRDNLKGIFFYSTPHRGILAPKCVCFLSLLESLMARSPLLPYVKILSKETARLNSDFDNLWNEERTCKLAGLGEGAASRWGTFYGLVVEEASSRHGADFLIDPGADHTSISRPPERISRRFTHLTGLLEDIALDSNNKKPDNFQVLPKSITGIQEVVESVKKMLVGTTWLVLYGMGGIGKTTLAMALFNDVERSYDYTCFIKGDNIQAEDMILQRMHYRGRKMTQNTTRLKNRMRGRKLLLILDGVDSSTELGIVKNLISDINPDKASLFVVTSRVKDVLPLEGCKLHLVEFLSESSSKELFLRCVTQNPSPNEHDLLFPSYVDKIVEKCDRLPLALEVVGEYLHKKTNEEDWKLIVRELDKAENMVVLNEKMWAKLRSSYCCLHEKEKNMFLDAATVFYKSDLRTAKAAWSKLDGYERHYWQRLVDCSMVLEDSEGDITKIGMQNQFLSMGRMIAVTPMENGSEGNSYRIWSDSEKAFKILLGDDDIMDEMDVKDIVALKSCSREIDPHVISMSPDMDLAPEKYIPISGSELCKMRKLEYLWLDGFHIGLNRESPLPSRIVYLHLSRMSFSDFSFIPLNPRRMIILSLNEINKLYTSPANFYKLEALQILRIEDNNSLEGLPLSTGKLAKLKYLSISLCPTLKRLPDGLGGLKALETLRICSCRSLLALPESIGWLRKLILVEILDCALDSLPDSLGELSMLIHLRIENCYDLRSLPDSLGKLKALETLTIVRCDSLSGLPNSLGWLSNLKVIKIKSCNSLKKLPGEFEEQRSLEHIELNEIWLRSVPNLDMITSLKTLRLSWGRTSTFPKLPECLQGHVTEENYTSPLTFNVESGMFQADPAGNSQDVPIGIVGILEGV